jgi:hypothetical protein
MRKFCLSLSVWMIGILPVAAHADDGVLTINLPVLPRAEIADRKRLSMVATPDYLSGAQHRSTEALAIGAGIVVGAAAGYSLPFPVATLVGGVVGGIVSHWWYNRETDDFQPLPHRD